MFSPTCRWFLSWLARKGEGAAYLEYALLAMLIAVACVGAVAAVGTAVAALLQQVVDQWPH